MWTYRKNTVRKGEILICNIIGEIVCRLMLIDFQHLHDNPEQEMISVAESICYAMNNR